MSVRATSQITLIDVSDAYNVTLTSESYTFVGTTSGAATGLKCTTQAVAFQGSNQCSVVTIDAKAITCPTGISAAVTNSGGASPTITFTTTAVITDSCEATIPIVVDDVTINKKFSFAVAKAGTNGKNGTSITISSKSVTYQVGDSGTTAPTGTWSTTIPTVAAGKYLWTKTIVTYSDKTSTEAYSVSYQGTNGTNGTSVTVKSSAVTYQASSSGTTAPTGTWSSSVPSVSNGQFLWTRTVVTYSDGKSTTSYSVSYKGTNGTNGADAVIVQVTSSNGNVFKNNQGSTVFTAHVYKGGVEQSITDAGVCGSLGSIKWYLGESTTALATSKTLSVIADDVINTATYTCSLEY